MKPSDEILNILEERLGKVNASEITVNFGKNNGRHKLTIYGELSDGPRDIVTEDHVAAFKNAISQESSVSLPEPNAKGNRPNPLFEIADGETILLRQERGGKNSINQLFQQQERSPQESPLLEASFDQIEPEVKESQRDSSVEEVIDRETANNLPDLLETDSERQQTDALESEHTASQQIIDEIYRSLKQRVDKGADLELSSDEASLHIYRQVNNENYAVVNVGEPQLYADFIDLATDQSLIEQLTWNPTYHLEIQENGQSQDVREIYGQELATLEALNQAAAEREISQFEVNLLNVPVTETGDVDHESFVEGLFAQPQSSEQNNPASTEVGDTTRSEQAGSIEQYQQISHDIWEAGNQGLVTETSVIRAAEETVQNIPESNTKQWLTEFLADLKNQTRQLADQVKHAQIALQQIENGNGIAGIKDKVHKTCQSPEVQLKIQSASQSVSHRVDRTFETVGQKIQQIGGWLASRPDAIRSKQAAEIAIALYDRGFARTEENRYTHGGFEVEKTGRDRFVLRDAATGTELLNFRDTRRWASDPPRITDIEPSTGRISSGTLEQLRQGQSTVDTLQGSVEGEQNRSQKVAQFAQVARTYLPLRDDRSSYRVEIGDDGIRVSTKGERGLIYAENQDGRVIVDQLQSSDFRRADEAIRSRQVEPFATVARLIHDHQLDLSENSYTIEARENFLRVTDAERGVIYEQRGNRINENLQSQDFERASATLPKVMQAIALKLQAKELEQGGQKTQLAEVERG